MAEVRPIVVNKDMIVLGGNMRLKAMQEAGWKDAPVQIVDWPEDKQKEFIIKDNVGFGEWDWNMIANDWDAEQVTDWGLDIPDFKIEDGEAEEDDFEIPIDVETDIVSGDIFKIGNHTLGCGNCTDTDFLSRLFYDELADITITDPPYGVSYTGKTKDKLQIQNDALSEEQTHQLWKDCLASMWIYLKEGGVIYATVPAGPLHIGFADAMKELGALRQIMVWNKGSMVMGRSDYHYKHEPILYGWKPGAAHYFVNDRTKTTVFDCEKPSANRDHPTMKPIKLWSEFIKNSSRNGDIIYDPFLGSGTTMVAAHQLNRKCYGMELDPKYCQVIVDRMLKLDPTLEVKRNGIPYKSGELQAK